jgi:uncharacterized hydrophobic protein (TIGR00341 family)
MSLRMIEIFLEGSGGELVREVLEDYPLIGLWHHETSDDSSVVKVLLDADKTDAVLDQLEKHFGQSGGFRTVLMPVEATFPRPEEPEEEAADEEPQEKEKPKIRGSRIGREELYADVGETARLSWVFVTMVVLSTIVATIGLLKDSVAVIIGAMVIAPLLGPNVALALATALGDSELARRAVSSNLVGVLIALVISVSAGYLFTIDPEIPEILARTRVDLGDILLALASGSAGALAFTTGVAASLIGVMVAVALLPPLVTTGLMLGSGQYELALGASLLLGTNVICVNLSGVITFLAQQVRPNTWWETDKARRATRIAIALWTLLLLVLAAIIVASRYL